MTAKMKAYPSFDAYLADQSARNQPLLRALRRFVKRAAPGLAEAVKWSNGCWIGDREPVAYLYSASDHVQFGFFRGSRLEDPDGLLRGSGQWVRHVRVETRRDIDARRLGLLLAQAVRLEKSLAAARPKATRPRARVTTGKRPRSTPA